MKNLKLPEDFEKSMKDALKQPKAKNPLCKRYTPVLKQQFKYKSRAKSSQDWNSYDLAQTKEFILFQEILAEIIDSLIHFIPFLGKEGRPFMDLKDMIFCCVMRVYLNKSLRRNIGYLYVAQRNGYIGKVPHYNTVARYYNNEILPSSLKHLIEQSGRTLKEIETDLDVETAFTIDSSGFSTSLFERWFNVRLQKKTKKRLWKKAHIVSGVKTNIICAIDISPGYYHDSLYLEKLVKITAKNFNFKEISGDGAYCSRKNMKIVSELGGVPYFRFPKNYTRKSRGCDIWNRMAFFYQKHKQKYLEKYHLRSNSESLNNSIKRKMGMSLYCKKERAQINEILCKCLAHNICVLIQEMIEMQLIIDFNKNCKTYQIKS